MKVSVEDDGYGRYTRCYKLSTIPMNSVNRDMKTR
jgi:hypothetical protein